LAEAGLAVAGLAIGGLVVAGLAIGGRVVSGRVVSGRVVCGLAVRRPVVVRAVGAGPPVRPVAALLAVGRRRQRVVPRQRLPVLPVTGRVQARRGVVAPVGALPGLAVRAGVVVAVPGHGRARRRLG